MASSSASGSGNRSDQKTTTTTTTLFVQAELGMFKEVVQKLTGAPRDSPNKLPVVTSGTTKSKPPVVPSPTNLKNNRLQERRRVPAKLELFNLHPHRHPPPPPPPPPLLCYYYCHYHGHYHYDNNNVVSPVSTMDSCYFLSSPTSSSSPLVIEEEVEKEEEEEEEEEEIAITEKGFYLYPSPTKCDGEPPKLLPLFPLTSPKDANHPN